MEIGVLHQSSYSRGQLLLRSFFGFIYILIPHGIALLVLSYAMAFTMLIAAIVILITGKYPKGLFTFHLNIMRWNYRVSARMINLCDGYPAFGLNVQDSHVVLNVEYPESSSRLLLLTRLFFGNFYVLIPHGVVMYLLVIASMFVNFIAFFAILFTAKYPEGMHKFTVGVTRWSIRVQLYMMCMTDKYPPFKLSGDEPNHTHVSETDDSRELVDQF